MSQSGTSRKPRPTHQLRMRQSAILLHCNVLCRMASSAGDDLLQSFDRHASLVGRAQEAEGWLQKLGMRFRGLQGRMFLEFCLKRRDVIAVMPTAGACSAARCRACMCAMMQQRMGHQGSPSLCCGWRQVGRVFS